MNKTVVYEQGFFKSCLFAVERTCCLFAALFAVERTRCLFAALQLPLLNNKGREPRIKSVLFATEKKGETRWIKNVTLKSCLL